MSSSSSDGRYEACEALWPRSPRQSKIKPLAKRLDTLNGKTIAQVWDMVFRGDEVFEFLEEGIKACLEPDAPLSTGAHCRWCPASTICTAREQEFVTAAKADFAGISLADVADELPAVEAESSFDLEQAARVVAAYQKLGPWIADLQERIDAHLMAGGHVTGFKVVQKMARRKWMDDEEGIASYLEVVYGIDAEQTRPRGLVTMTEVKRLLKQALPRAEAKAAEEDITLRFTIKDSDGLTVAPESDRRAAISPIAAEFGSVQLGSTEGM